MNKEEVIMMTKVIIIGHVVNTPEIKQDYVGASMLCFMVGTNQLAKARIMGQTHSVSENHQVILYNNKGMSPEPEFSMGDVIAVVGLLRSTPVVYAGTTLVYGGWVEAASIRVIQRYPEPKQPKEPPVPENHTTPKEPPKGKRGVKKGLKKKKLRGNQKITDKEIIYWMKKLNNNKSKVAEQLGVVYQTILRNCKRLGI
jgi:hypothetical protein